MSMIDIPDIFLLDSYPNLNSFKLNLVINRKRYEVWDLYPKAHIKFFETMRYT